MIPATDPGGLPEVLKLCSRLGARRDELVATEAATVKEVALAKGRQLLRPAIEGFLEGLQADAHRRNVGSYEALLSLVATEVVPTAGPIGLDLTVKRSLPALDIFVRKPEGGRSDIYEDQGGALTNAVSTGLRLIAAVKSGRRKLVVLDETDCWIKPERVRSYLEIVHQTARELTLQTIMISHHDASLLPDGVPLARVEGLPASDEGVRIENDPRRHVWTDDEPGMRYVRMLNVQSYADTTLHLCPGLTAVCGDNNLGKSIVTRALRAAFHGEGREGLVRDRGATEAVVEIGLERGRVLRYVRRLKGNPIQSWTLLEADGSIHDGCDAGGREVPAWVAEKVGIADDAHHFARQKEPVFLLDRSPAERASVLSIGRESELIRVMQDLQKADVTADSRLARDGEKAIAALRERISRLSDVAGLEAEAERLRGTSDALRTESEHLRNMETAVAGLMASRARAEAAAGRTAVLGRLPQDGIAQTIEAGMADTLEMTQSLKSLLGLRQASGVARDRSRLLSNLPLLPELEELGTLDKDVRALMAARVAAYARSCGAWARSSLPEFPEPSVATDAEADLARLVQARMAATAAASTLATAKSRLEENQTACTKAITALGGVCPTCGGGLGDAAHFLAHDAGAAA